MSYNWVLCPNGEGWHVNNDGAVDRVRSHFGKNSVGLIEKPEDGKVIVWLIGDDSRWLLLEDETKPIDLATTGDRHKHKICNICHCLKPVSSFSRNQNNRHGIVRRPSCMDCRARIEMRPITPAQKRAAKEGKPEKGAPFRCPICRKRSIVDITAKVVADHDHKTGDVRDFICDSCNTGLGRFKNGENYLLNAITYLREHGE